MASPCLPTRIGLLAVVALLAVFPRRGSAAGCDGRASGCTVFAKAKDVREKVETLALETAAKIEADFATVDKVLTRDKSVRSSRLVLPLSICFTSTH